MYYFVVSTVVGNNVILLSDKTSEVILIITSLSLDQWIKLGKYQKFGKYFE